MIDKLIYNIKEYWYDYQAWRYQHHIDIEYETLKSVMRHHCKIALTKKDKERVWEFYHELARQVIESPKKRLDLKLKKKLEKR